MLGNKYLLDEKNKNKRSMNNKNDLYLVLLTIREFLIFLFCNKFLQQQYVFLLYDVAYWDYSYAIIDTMLSEI